MLHHFPMNLILDDEDEVLQGAGDQVVGVEYLPEGIGELLVIFQKIKYLNFGILAQTLYKYRLRKQKAAT